MTLRTVFSPADVLMLSPACLRRRSVALAAMVLGMVAVPPGDCKRCACAAEVAPVDPQAVQQAVDRAVAYLKANTAQQAGGRATLTALALLKCDVPADSPEVARVLEGITKKVVNGTYAPTSKHEHGYESGLDAITLETADRDKYRPEIEAIAKYLIGMHSQQGHWNYGDSNTPVGGDTSITQYGILGLWAASRAGVKVPLQTWDKAALWHLKTQRQDGGFCYHPIDQSGQPPTIGMTTAGTASLHVCRMHLYPRAGIHATKTDQKPQPQRPTKRFGVLERVEPEKPAEKGPAAAVNTNYNPTAGIDRIDAAIEGGLTFLTARFTVEKVDNWRCYFLYTLERLTALADLEFIGEHDWYAEGATYLLAKQKADGSWMENSGGVIDTSFATLFLVRATNKMMNRQPVKKTVGGGLLAGGRGLPEDLKGVEVKDGKIGSRKVQGPLDELLSELESTKSAPVGAVQKAIVESVQLGDREALLAQGERLKRLAKDPRVEVRRTAVWALGRGRDVRTVPLLIGALEDSDVDVVVEAHNGLCFFARKPQGIGAPLNPIEGLDEDATAEQRTAALAKWRANAVKLWKAWYLTVRPYDERHDLAEPKASAK
jgi:hypothetical protein